MSHQRGLLPLSGLLACSLAAGCSSSAAPVAPIPRTADQTSAVGAVSGKDAHERMVAALTAAAVSPHHVRAASWLDRHAFRRVIDDATASSSTSSRLVYVSNGATGTVDIFPYKNNPVKSQNQPMIGQITGFSSPNGLAVDRAGDLFVCDFYGDTVTEYTPASMPNPALTIPFPYAPTGVAVDDNGKNLYVSGDVKFPNGQVGVAVYAQGATTPYKYLTDPTLVYTQYPFLDNQGGVYIGYYNQSSTQMGVFRKGSSALARFYLTNDVYQGQIDQNGNLIASDPGLGTIDTYPSGTGQTNPNAVGVQSGGGLIFFDLNRKDTQVFATGQGTAITQYAFPSGGLENTISGSNANYAFGIVTFPDNPLPVPYQGYASAPPSATPVPSTPPPSSPTSTPAPAPTGPTPMPTACNCGESF